MNEDEHKKLDALIDAHFKVVDIDSAILDYDNHWTFEEYKDMVMHADWLIDLSSGRTYLLSRRWEDDIQARLQKIKESEEE